MEPDPAFQVKFGLAACLLALLVILFFAFVPDPLFRNRSFHTWLDDVAGVQPGTSVYFRGAAIGEVRSIDLDPATRKFAVRLSVSRNWRATACSHVSVSAANPLTAPRLELAALEGAAAASPAACALARQEQACIPVAKAAPSGDNALVGCRRAADLMQTAALAVTEAVRAARSANELALQLQGMVAGGKDGSGPAGAMIHDAQATAASISSLTAQLDRAFRPGQGDMAVTLGNLRRFSGRAADIDIAAANEALKEVRQMVAQNQASIAELLTSSAGTATQARATLEASSASLVQAGVNLERMSASLDDLAERLSADPTYLIRGRRHTDPPPPEGAP